MTSRIVAFVAALVCATSALAQNQFITPFGTALGITSSSVTTVNLGHSFTMPGGLVVNSLDIDENCRIFPVGSDGSEWFESTQDLLFDPFPQLAFRWDGGSLSDPYADVYFDTNASRTLISWVNYNFGIGIPATGQVQLWADGRVVYVYDSRINYDDGHVGLSAGGAIADPGEVDLSSSVDAPIVSTTPIVYEDFGVLTGFSLDLQSTALEFVPNDPTTLTGYTVYGNTGVVDANPPFATTQVSGLRCLTPPNTTVFTPNGSGGYIVSNVPSLFDVNIGPSLGATSANGILTNGGAGYDLGFPFPFPGGMTSQFVDVDPNGRIVPSGLGAVGDFSPELLDFETDGYPMICLWTDFNVAEPGSGNIHFTTDGVSRASFTWNGVKQRDNFNRSKPVTVQISLLSDGTAYCTLEDLSGFNHPDMNGTRDIMIGVSDGVTTGTPQLDLSETAITPVDTTVGAWEFFDTGGAMTEEFDLQFPMQPKLVALTNAVTGANWELQVQDLPSATTLGGFVLIDFSAAAVPLDAVGITGCTLQVPFAPISMVLGDDGTGNSNILSTPVPNDTSNYGLTFYVQGGSDGAPFSPLPIWLVNSVAAKVGF